MNLFECIRFTKLNCNFFRFESTTKQKIYGNFPQSKLLDQSMAFAADSMHLYSNLFVCGDVVWVNDIRTDIIL